MATDDRRRTRRAFLATAAAGAAAVTAAQLAKPGSVLAADPNDLVLNQDNPITAKTSATQGTADTDAFEATGNGKGAGLRGIATSGGGVIGAASEVRLGGVLGLDGPTTDSAFEAVEDDITGTATLETGVYGWANQSANSSGVFGESLLGAGMIGFGQWGCVGLGFPGVFGESFYGTGVHGHGGDFDAPAEPNKTGVLATASPDGVALEVRGKAKFNRSKKTTIAKGHSSLKVTLAGVTSASYVLATLQSNRPGVYVQAVVCGTGSFTIYLNKAPTSATYVAYLVVN